MDATLTLRRRLARHLFAATAACSGGPSIARLIGTASLAVVLVTPAVAQTPAASTGVIAGRVFNVASGSYLNNARVRVDGTSLEAFTNSYGEYRIAGVPAGPAKVTAFYTGLPVETISVEVVAGQTVSRTINLGGDQAEEDTMKLDTFTVLAQRETNVAAIATNEQRFAPNIKTVIETDAFGDIAEGNVGEFLKFLPGITVDYVAADVRTVSVRGFPAAFTSVAVDGFRMASASSGASQRAFEFEQVSINNASRVEVSKVPIPSQPADAMGGAVNMIGKNAFEREGVQFNYRAYINMSSENMDIFSKTPGPGRKETYKALPGFDFDLTIPVSKNLGFVITGLTSNQFNEQHRTQKNWNFAEAGATQTNPFLQSYVMQDGPKNSFRDSTSIKMDWRISDVSSMWVAYQFNYYKSFFGNRNVTWNVGNNATSATQGGTNLSWDQDTVTGATGRGSVSRGSSFRDKLGASNALMAKYRYFNNGWEFDAGAAYSVSRSWYRDIERGHFNGVNATMQNISRVSFDNINDDRPQVIQAYNAAGVTQDWSQLVNYRLSTVTSTPLDATDEYKTGHANLKRDLPFSFRSSLKAGVDLRVQDRDINRRSRTWNFVGADGLANTADDNAGALHDTRYGVDPHWGLQTIQWPDPFLLGDLFISNPNYFQQTVAQQLATERFRIQNSQALTETITSAYLQFDAKFFQDRLSLTTGVRFEKTDVEGNGPLTPTGGLTLADIAANWRERGLKVNRAYDGYYPSINLNYEITPSFIARAAYAYSLGRPDFGNVLPLVRINDTDVVVNDGIGNINPRTIIYNNTALEPWEGQGWDLSLEYYFKNGGLLSLGLFGKDIDNFFGTRAGIATQADLDFLGLESEYLGYATQTSFNIDGKAKITGWELNLRQPLTFLPVLSKNFEFFFNYTALDLSGADADFQGFIEKSASTGLTFRHKALTLRGNVNFRGRQILAPQTGAAYGGAAAGFRQYFDDRMYLDLNAEYKFHKRLALFFNARNSLNEPQDSLRYNATTPDYAQLWQREEFAVQMTLGVKGTW